jgi:uncharacterized membrane protein YobD (UPF0266 family)
MLQLKQFIRNYKSDIMSWLLVILATIGIYVLGTKEMKTAISISLFYFLPIWIYQTINQKRKSEHSITK